MTPLGPKRVYYEQEASRNWRRPIETGEDYDQLISEDGGDLISEDGSDLIPEDAAFCPARVTEGLSVGPNGR